MTLGSECGGYEADISFDVPSVGERPVGDTTCTELIAAKQSLFERWDLRWQAYAHEVPCEGL